ncbi:MAG: Zn-dependent alcohol dehydrogenase [Candidatus Hydrogenedentes bacterium]|nr:Zn-dependent alcohol dehydrogenase [Candidatus Hydrogenedentota bacterium]
MKMKAVVAHELNRFAVEEVTLDPPKAGEVLVKMKATGICHSDLSAINGTIPIPFPMVLGHEGAGIVQEVGTGVTNVKPGDHVTLSFVPNCGDCYHCLRSEPYLCLRSNPNGKMMDGTSRVHLKGNDLNVMQFLGNMAEYAVVPAMCLVKISDDIDMKAAALVGCGVTTGVGAALKTAQVKPGSTVAVFGAGGVGLSIIQGARIAGAARIFAVDLSDEKLAIARDVGATDLINAADDPLRKIMELTDGIGVDYGFEAIGIPAVVDQAQKATRRGGTMTVVGVGKLTQKLELNALMFPLTAKTFKGSMYGSAEFRVDFPKYLELYRQGKLDLDRMVTHTYRIDEAPQAFADLEAGRNARGVIVYD